MSFSNKYFSKISIVLILHMVNVIGQNIVMFVMQQKFNAHKKISRVDSIDKEKTLEEISSFTIYFS